jgi:hypothetical protein
LVAEIIVAVDERGVGMLLMAILRCGFQKGDQIVR